MIDRVGGHGPHGADSRRERHGQGTGRAGALGGLAAARQAVRQGELCGAANRAARVRAVRVRAGRLHRRDSAQARQVRVREPRHDVPRRDQRDEPGPAGQAPPGAPGRRILAARRQARRPGGRPHHRRHQPRSRALGRAGRISGGSLLPPQCRVHSASALAGPPRGAAAVDRLLPQEVLRSIQQAAQRDLDRRRWRSSWSTTGPGTSASWRT